MTQYTRPDGATGFADMDDTVVVPSVATNLDTIINGMIAAYNAIDNTNIAAAPKISSAKVDLTTGGYLPLDGSANMSGAITSAFDGVFQVMRASGNGQIRYYRGSDGAIWGVSYNTYWTGSAWSGRDVTDICTVLKMESDGLHYYHAVSAGVGVVPTWVELFSVGLNGLTTTYGHLAPYAAGDYIIASADTLGTRTDQVLTKVKEFYAEKAGVYRTYFEIRYVTGNGGGPNCTGQIYKNGSAFGTLRTNTTTSFVGYTEDLTFAAGDLIQLYVQDYFGSSGSAGSMEYQNCRLKVSAPAFTIVTLNG